MSDHKPVQEKPAKAKRGRRPKAPEANGKPNGANGVQAAPPAAPPIQVYTAEQGRELATLAVQATRFGPNPGFLSGQPIELIRAALIESMPQDWRDKGAHGWVANLRDPQMLVLVLTYFAAYWNLGFVMGEAKAKSDAEKK